jgi:hypothetical protein
VQSSGFANLQPTFEILSDPEPWFWAQQKQVMPPVDGRCGIQQYWVKWARA